MNKLLLCVFALIDLCCNSQKEVKDKNLNILIEEATSKYDLTKQAYTVHRYEGDSTIKFELTKLEKEKIVSYYYNLKLDELHDKLTIEDNCMTMPKFYSTLTVKSKTQNQKIIIDIDCKDYKGIFNTKGKRVSLFIYFVENIINSNPKIKSVPESNYIFE
ncbi:MAG: hypothetical protein ABJB05_05410 [Parafilimonas sp.]